MAPVPESAWHTVMLVPYEGALIEFEALWAPGSEPLRGRFVSATTAGAPRWWINLSGRLSYLEPTIVETARIMRWRYL